MLLVLEPAHEKASKCPSPDPIPGGKTKWFPMEILRSESYRKRFEGNLGGIRYEP